MVKFAHNSHEMIRATLFFEKHFGLENNDVFYKRKANVFTMPHTCIYVDGVRFFFYPFCEAIATS
jgi:hypothetical protein